MAFEKVGVRAVVEGLGRFNRDARLISKRLKEVTRDVKKLEKESLSLTKRLEKLSPGFKRAGLALTAMAAAGAVFIAKATMLAARVETLGVVTETLGKNVGKTKDEIRALEKAVSDQGITLRAARTSIALMIQSNVDLAHAVDLAAEAQNAAVIAGVDSSEAFQRLVFVITSGNVRMARTLGLQVRFQDAYKKLAETLGKTSIELTEQERVSARTNAVLKAGERIVGAYDAAMETAGKKVFSLNRHIEESTRIMGELFLPLFADAVDLLTEFLEGIEDASEAQQRGIAATIAATTAVSGLSGVTLLFLSQITGLLAHLKLLGITIAGVTVGAVGLTAALLGLATIGAVKSAVEVKTLKDNLEDLRKSALEADDDFDDFKAAILEAAAGTDAYKISLSESLRTHEDVFVALARNIGLTDELTEENFKAAQEAFRAAEAQNALRGALRGVGTTLQRQITDLKISELSYEDYTEEVEALAKANDLTVISQQEFTDAVNRGVSPLKILENSVLQATEKQFDLAKSAEASDRKLLGLLGTERDAASATEMLANKLGLTEEELLDVAEAAGIAIEGLEELPEDIEIKIKAELEKQAQERIQTQLDDLKFTIDTDLTIQFADFQEDIEDINQELDELEIEKELEIERIFEEGVEAAEDLEEKIGDQIDRRDDLIRQLAKLQTGLKIERVSQKEAAEAIDKANEKLEEQGKLTEENKRELSEAQRLRGEVRVEAAVFDISETREAIAEITEEINNLEGQTAFLVDSQEQELSDLEGIYLDKMRGRVADIDEVTEAWSRQTKEIILNLATQRFGIDGFTDEELDALTKLAGPEGLGLIDQAAVELLEGVDELNQALLLPGDQVDIVVGAMSNMAEAMVDPRQNAIELAEALDGIGRASMALAAAREPFFGPLGLGRLIRDRQGGGPVRRGEPYRVGELGEELFIPNQSGVVIPNNLTSALSSFLTAATSAIPIAGAGVPASAAGGGGTTQNFNMTVNTRAPAEQIAADFNLLALMGARRG